MKAGFGPVIERQKALKFSSFHGSYVLMSFFLQNTLTFLLKKNQIISEENTKPLLASLASLHFLLWYFDTSVWWNNYLVDGTRYLVTKISVKSLVLFLKYMVIFVDLQ